MRELKALCTQGSAINRQYETFLTKFSNVRLNANISDVSSFFLRAAVRSRWLKPSFVERPAHRTVH